jgi:photosystem II stability/assembly factor-like uncharacterized protein
VVARIPVVLAAFLAPALASASAAIWISTGPTGAVVQAIAADPTSDGVVYAGTRNGGVFKSDPFGAPTWHAVNDGLGDLNVRSIAALPGVVRLVLAGTDTGLFRSTNGGDSWEEATGSPAEPIDQIAFDPSAPLTAYAVSFTGWIGKSTNGGASWQTLGGPASGQRPQAVTVDPTHGATVYVGTLDDGVYKSEDGGASWVERNEGLLNLHVSAIVVSPTSPSDVYVGIENGGAFRSTDGGLTWEMFNTGLQGGLVEALAADATGRIYLANSRGVWGLIEGGLGWALLEAIPFPNALAIGPGDPGFLWVGWGQLPQAQGGVAFSEDRSDFFSAPADGLNGATLSALAVDPSNPNRIVTAGPLAGALSDDGGSTWLGGFVPGFGLSLAFDPQAPGVVYEGVAGGVQKSADGGESWAAAGVGLPSNALVRALLVLRGAPGRVLAGTAAGVYRTSDGGANWAAPGTAAPAVVYALARDSSSATTVWAGADNGVYRSTDEGVTWALSGAATGSPVFSVLDSVVAPATTFAGTSVGLLVSSDGGASWTAVGAGLLVAEVFALAEDPGRSAIYAAGSDGVFESLDGGVSWAHASAGLTNPYVTSLLVLPGGKLLAGTRGGSIFQRVETSVEREPVERSEGRGTTRELSPRP